MKSSLFLLAAFLTGGVCGHLTSFPSPDEDTWCFEAGMQNTGRAEQTHGVILIFDNDTNQYVATVPEKFKDKLQEEYAKVACK